jgi:PTS system nitrogen regulatory IIA component
VRISEILSGSSVCAELSAKNKKSVLEELVSLLAAEQQAVDRGELLRVLLEREKLGSTGIGDGIAIPHGKSSQVKRLLACFGRSTEGVDFVSMDGKPAHLFFLLVAPENSAGVHLKALARISRLLKDGLFRKRLMEAHSREELYSAILGEDERYL